MGFLFVVCFVLIMIVVDGFFKMWLIDIYEGVIIFIFVLSGYREISVCNKGLKLGIFNFIISF